MTMAAELDRPATTMSRLKGIFEECFASTFEDFGSDTSPRTIRKWDSQANIRLILAIEESFSIEFQPEEMGEMKDVGAICAKIAEKLPNGVT
jgi:acyl carrier protein